MATEKTAQGKAPAPAEGAEAQESAQVTPDWEKVIYTPERVGKYIKGEITGAQLHALTGPEMLQMALIGFQMYEQGKYEEARVLFDGLCMLDPKESYYPTALGAVYLATDELDYAESCFNRAIKLNPNEIASYVNRGEVYLRKGKVLEAAQDFKRAVDLDPEGKDPLTQRARVLAAAALEMIEGKGGDDKPAKKSEKKEEKKPAAKGGGKKK